MFLRYRKKNSFHIELAPLIDIVFILLIFFAVSSSLITQEKSIPINLPTAESGEDLTSDIKEIIISLKENKDIYIDQQKIIPTELLSTLSQFKSNNSDVIVKLNAAKSLPYQTIISTLDTIRLSGCTNIGLQIDKEIILD